MPSIEIHINLLWLPIIAIGCCLLGFIFRSAQLYKAKQKVTILENEMLQNHQEILTLQKDLARLHKGAGDSKTPVVSIKDTPLEEKGPIVKRLM